MGLGQKGNALVLLLAILAIVFCIFKFIQLSYTLTGVGANSKESIGIFRDSIFNWFTLPATFDLLLERPWTLLSYMFIHDEVFHMIGNLIWLWVFGYILQDLTGSKTIIPLFIYC